MACKEYKEKPNPALSPRWRGARAVVNGKAPFPACPPFGGFPLRRKALDNRFAIVSAPPGAQYL